MAVQAINNLIIPQANDPNITKSFFKDIADILSEDEKFSLLKVHIQMVGFEKKSSRKKFVDYLRQSFLDDFKAPSGPNATTEETVAAYLVAKSQAEKRTLIYELSTCKEAVKKGENVANSINYWLCYPDPSLTLGEEPSWIQLAGLKSYTKTFEEWCWDPVLVKFHNRQVCFPFLVSIY